MSLMNLQKLRQVCYRDEYGAPSMEITLPPNDFLNRVVFKDDQDKSHTAQIKSIYANDSFSSGFMEAKFDTEVDLSTVSDLQKFNRALARAFLPRLNQILAEHGFHSRFLLSFFHVAADNSGFKRIYYDGLPVRAMEQIRKACYTDGRSMRRAVEYQSRLNKL